MQIQTKGSNPVLRNTLDGQYRNYQENFTTKHLSRQGVVSTTLLLLLIVSATAYGVIAVGSTNPQLAITMNLIGITGAFAMGFVIAFNQKARVGSPVLSILFSVFEGLMVGGFTFSIGMNLNIQGVDGFSVVLQAIIGTIGLFFVALFVYWSKLINVNKKFISFVVCASLGFAAMYAINLAIAIITGSNLLFSSGPIPIAIGVVAIVMGTLSLLVDFKNIDVAIESGLPDKIKWTIATGIMTSLVWIYIETLRVMYLILSRSRSL